MDSTETQTISTTHISNKDFSIASAGRNYGVVLGLISAIYLIVVNLAYSNADLPVGLRFAKHLLIIPVVWMAVSAYANQSSGEKIFKPELGLLTRIAAWSAVTLALANILFFAVTATSFEQFMNQGKTLFDVMINSGFLIFETVVFVMIIGFAILQAYKGKGSPED